MPPPVKGYYAGLIAIISAAAAASTTVFFLFGSFLEKVLPPFGDSELTVGFATFGTATLLLVLSLAIQKKLSAAATRTVIGACTGLLFCSAALFVYFQDTTRTYTYRFPPQSQQSPEQRLHFRGDLHEKGREYVGNKTVAQAVFELGGPDFVNSRGLLWSEEARLRQISKIQSLYILLTALLTTAVFSAALALWRLVSSKK